MWLVCFKMFQMTWNHQLDYQPKHTKYCSKGKPLKITITSCFQCSFPWIFSKQDQSWWQIPCKDGRIGWTKTTQFTTIWSFPPTEKWPKSIRQSMWSQYVPISRSLWYSHGSCESARKADAENDTGETTMVPVDLTEMADETAMRSVDVADEVTRTRLEIFIQFGVHDIEPFFLRPCQ